MTLGLVLALEAASELEAATEWYEREAALGAKFAAEVRQVLMRIARMPLLHGVLFLDTRCARVRRYNYNVFYRVESDRVLVLAILHGSRDPDIWRSRS